VYSSCPELNKYLKDEITKGGKKRRIRKKKYEMIGTHTGRRSFATNFYSSGKIPIGQILAITGHKKESTFFSYIRTSPEEHAQQFLDSMGDG
jgi:integrase